MCRVFRYLTRMSFFLIPMKISVKVLFYYARIVLDSSLEIQDFHSFALLGQFTIQEKSPIKSIMFTSQIQETNCLF